MTARAEMLYALLVEGSGPLGSVFSPDEFTTKEVQDTDGDGLPEFVDAWGQPLQFFRWPLLYSSDIQRGQVIATTATAGAGTGWALSTPYTSVFQTREQDPLDPNQQLVAPAWWTASFNDSWPSNYSGLSIGGATAYSAMTPTPSGGVMAIEYFFHSDQRAASRRRRRSVGSRGSPANNGRFSPRVLFQVSCSLRRPR